MADLGGGAAAGGSALEGAGAVGAATLGQPQQERGNLIRSLKVKETRVRLSSMVCTRRTGPGHLSLGFAEPALLRLHGGRGGLQRSPAPTTPPPSSLLHNENQFLDVHTLRQDCTLSSND